MNKAIIGAIAAIIIVGGIVWYASAHHSKTEVKSDATMQNHAEMKSESNAQSIKEMIAAGKSQKCTSSTMMNNMQTQGVTYISNGKMRGSYETTVNGQTIKPQMIIDNGTMYSWNEGVTTGFKMTIPPDAIAATTTSTSIDVNQKVDYKCESWTPDNASFTVPANVQFTDPSAMMMNAGASADIQAGAATHAQSMQCAACDQAPADSKAQCKAALHCN